MPRAVVSSKDIQEAIRAGKNSLNLPPGALITPLAAEEARAGGLRLGMEKPGTVPVCRDTSSSGKPGHSPKAPDGHMEDLPGVRVARCQPGPAPSAPDALILREALTPGPDGPGIGQICWKDASFTWVFEADEVLVVTEGKLTLTASGNAAKELQIGPGEAVRIRAGASLTLSARGSVSCVTASWNPQPCANAK